MSIVGRIFNISHYSVHDGPGIRTTVFFKGCPARCLWCCSPQSQCFECEPSASGDKIYGRDVSAADLFAEIRKDALFWRRSGGGVTLSGGEVLAQPRFAAELLWLCHKHNVHTAIETCLYAEKKVFKQIIDETDYVQFDLKLIDQDLHKKFTGIGNKRILDNASFLLSQNKDVLVRIPLVPSYTDSEDNLMAIGSFLESRRAGVKVEILKYHRLGVGLYEELGRRYMLSNIQEPSDAEFIRAQNILKNYKLTIL